MGLQYYKRFRMEAAVAGRALAAPQLPPGYSFVPWHESLLEAHADTKFRSFRDEIDSNVFPCLGERIGCSRLMGEIRQKPGFLPAATWLVRYDQPLEPLDRDADQAGGEFEGRGGFAVLTGLKRRATRGRLSQTETDVEFCGTIQGIVDRSGMGAVQNLGVTPEHRGKGLGNALMLQALAGFQAAGLKHVFLEVTCQNEGAVRLYRRLGFHKARTIYKVVEVAYS